ncbi:MAG: hypothetical protein EZS28_050026 [Streblomastix strix]|uniref:Uncharacterized protein n=1 Tax=Streblomastix strix TaxID=222440 RepID=A0A5J4T868_9EUKA|nr:MAG: hypothetical protein EZS28_050026 [Streblomastix strix]
MQVSTRNTRQQLQGRWQYPQCKTRIKLKQKQIDGVGIAKRLTQQERITMQVIMIAQGMHYPNVSRLERRVMRVSEGVRENIIQPVLFPPKGGGQLALCKVGDIFRNVMQGYGTPSVIRRADLSHSSQLRCPPLRSKRGCRGQRRDGRAMNEIKTS